jgi:uncharacterized membrane protein YqjE
MNTTGRHPLTLLMSMLGTRLELAAIDVEAHMRGTLVALMTAFVAVVLGLIAFAFIGIGVIVFFWETHRVAAATAVTLAYVVLAAMSASLARAKWNARPAPLAATIHEIGLDREALRSRS